MTPTLVSPPSLLCTCALVLCPLQYVGAFEDAEVDVAAMAVMREKVRDRMLRPFACWVAIDLACFLSYRRKSETWYSMAK